MFIARIKGTTRRRLAYETITSGLPDVPEVIFDTTLSEEAREAWGAVHPALMGGEYLPDREPGEVEIVRLELASTTADVIAVLAHREDGEIRYRVVDEYDSNYVFSPGHSREPLTLGEVVALLDQAYDPNWHAAARAYGLLEGFWEWNLRTGDSPEHAAQFVSVSSSVYPALSDYYGSRAREWIATSRKNPLSPEAVVALEDGWRRATSKKRAAVADFLGSHGYERGWFRKYGARDLDAVLLLLDR